MNTEAQNDASAPEQALVVSGFEIVIDYDIRVEEAARLAQCTIQADARSKFVSRNFPTERSGIKVCEITLLRAAASGRNRRRGSPESTPWILSRLDALGFRPIDCRELLAFAAIFPDAARAYEIIALGSPIAGPVGDMEGTFYPAVEAGPLGGAERSEPQGVEINRRSHATIELKLISGKFGWLGSARFAAMRK